MLAVVDFYPRPLRGGRRAGDTKRAGPRRFLSTPSARRATLPLHHADVAALISIHALCEEGDDYILTLV